MRRSALRSLVLTLVLSTGLANGVQACPNCKDALANQTGDAARLKDGYTYSILFMMSMPFVLLGTGAFFVYRAVRRGDIPEL
jgi:hypothetical protein